MGARGRQPTPTVLKVLRGVTPSRIGKGEPTTSGRPEPVFPLDDEAQRIWDVLMPHLAELGVVGQADSLALTMLVQAAADYQHYREMVAVAPLIKDRNGSVRRNPASFGLENAALRIAKWAPQFGLTPSSRVMFARPTDEQTQAGRLLNEGGRSTGNTVAWPR